jgi:hypothetical protein
LLWRISPEPVIALDGDKAGLRAAMRLVDLALPHLGPDKSLRFAILPEGQDPDDLIRARGLRHAGGHRPAPSRWSNCCGGARRRVRSSTHQNGARGSTCGCAPPSG